MVNMEVGDNEVMWGQGGCGMQRVDGVEEEKDYQEWAGSSNVVDGRHGDGTRR